MNTANSRIFDMLFAPLGKEYCNYFLYLSMISFMLVIFILGTALAASVSGRKPRNIMLMVYSAVNLFVVGYFNNRLFYSMCVV